MARVILRERDVEALSGFLEILADPCSVNELRHRAVETIPTVVTSAFTVWNEFDPETNEMARPIVLPSSRLAGGLEVGQAIFDRRAIFATHAKEQPIMQHYVRTRDGRPCAISDFYSRQQFHNTKLFQEFYGPLGVEDQIAIQLPSPSRFVAITLHREWQDFPQRRC